MPMWISILQSNLFGMDLTPRPWKSAASLWIKTHKSARS